MTFTLIFGDFYLKTLNKMKEGRYVIVKAIPLGRGKEIKVGSELVRTHNCYYLDGYLLDKDFQKDFETLLMSEIKRGWNYLRPNNLIIGKSLIGNL